MTVSSLLNMEFVQALNPLYAFPIVAVILCVFVVYAFGFKAPVQPPSFEGFAEEKKVSKKRKTKDLNKGKAVQNGNISIKAQIPASNKKKEAEKPISTDKVVEKSSEKKASKNAKPVNEKRLTQEKKKESFSHEDTGDDGWVQLVSKKGRKGRKKEETNSVENQDLGLKVTKSSFQSNVFMPDKEPLKEENSNVEKPTLNDKPSLNEDKKIISEAPVIEAKEDVMKKDAKFDTSDVEKENEKLPKESSNKSKKKKKKNTDVVNMEEILVSPSESPSVEIISEVTSQNETKNSSDDKQTLEVITGNEEEIQLKTPKSSNVVFDELAGLCPEPKELRKKKKVRRDH